MNRFPTIRSTPVAAAVFATLHTISIKAQTPEAPQRQLPAISVTGEGEEPSTYKPERAASPKFTEPLLDTPQTVVVIRREVMAEQGASNLTDALRNIPGITFQLGENGNTQSGDTIFMRGFDSQNSVFLDGVRDLGAAVRDVFNVEQVEVFKGPSGADYGRGATSGYVNLVSKVPLSEDSFGSSVAYGTEQRRRLTADWNKAFDAAGGAAFRLNVMGAQGGIAGREFIERESWGIAPSFAWGLANSTRFYLFSQHVRQDNVPDGAVPAIGIADYVIPALATAGIGAAAVDPETYYGLNEDFEDIEADMVTFRVEHDFSENVVLRNLSRYGKGEQERILTAPLQAPIVVDGNVVRTNPATWTLGRSRHASYRENEIITNQTNLTARFATGGLSHSLSSGAEFIYEKQTTPTYGGLGTLAPISLYSPDRNGVFTVAPAPAPSGAYSEGDTLTSAIYAFDTIDLTERWQLHAGLRLEHYETQTESVAVSTTTPVVTTLTEMDNSDLVASWKLGILYKPSEASSVYLAFANSLKPPGADNFTLNDAINANGTVNVNNSGLDPQKATNIELGAKWDLLEGALAATGAIFHSENKNDLARTDPGNPDVIIQYGEKEVEGIELGLVGRFTPAWELMLGVTRQNTEVTQGSITGTAPSTQTGAVINFSPKLSATLWTTYKLPFGLTLGGGARHVATQARQINNAPTTGGVVELPSYTVVDAFGAYAITEQVTVQLNAYNLADEEYVSSINNSGQRYLGGIPRSYLLTVDFNF